MRFTWFLSFCYGQNSLVTGDVQLDVIGNLKAGFLTHGLNLGDDLTDHTLFQQLGSQGGVDSNGDALILNGEVLGGLDHLDQQIGGSELNLGAVCRYPYGIFLCNFEKPEDITDGATIAIPESAEGIARALLLLEANGFIKVKEGAGLSATLDDIAENSRNFKFVTQDDKALAANIDSYEADIAVMQSDLCIGAGHLLNRTARAIEELDSDAAKEYAHVLLINKSDISSDWYTAVSPLFFSALMFETVDNHSGDLIVPAFSLSQKS